MLVSVPTITVSYTLSSNRSILDRSQWMLVMWSLPDCATVWIFAHLQDSDWEAVAAVSRYFNAIARSKELIALLFERDLFLSTVYNSATGPLAISYSTQFQLLKAVKRMNKEKLDYHGFATNGGVDEDNTHFWLHKVFKKSRSSVYCSQESTRNVNIAGVLKASQELLAEKAALQKMKERLLEAASKIDRGSRRLREVVENEDSLQMYGSEILKHFAATDPELLLLPGEQLADMQKSIREVLGCIKSESPKINQLLQHPDNRLVLAESVPLPGFPTCTQIAFLKSVRVSRKGDFTCPVQTLMVFTSLTYVSIESTAFEVYNNLWTLGDVKALVDSTASVPPVHSITTENSYTVCEFRGKAGCELQPVFWLDFSPGESRELVVRVPLQQAFPSLYLYAKLIKPEDRRVERGWEHELMNIDIRYIHPKGQVMEVEVSAVQGS